jgi:hypothetical protein
MNPPNRLVLQGVASLGDEWLTRRQPAGLWAAWPMIGTPCQHLVTLGYGEDQRSATVVIGFVPCRVVPLLQVTARGVIGKQGIRA